MQFWILFTCQWIGEWGDILRTRRHGRNLPNLMYWDWFILPHYICFVDLKKKNKLWIKHLGLKASFDLAKILLEISLAFKLLSLCQLPVKCGNGKSWISKKEMTFTIRIHLSTDLLCPLPEILVIFRENNIMQAL